MLAGGDQNCGLAAEKKVVRIVGVERERFHHLAACNERAPCPQNSRKKNNRPYQIPPPSLVVLCASAPLREKINRTIRHLDRTPVSRHLRFSFCRRRGGGSRA